MTMNEAEYQRRMRLIMRAIMSAGYGVSQHEAARRAIAIWEAPIPSGGEHHRERDDDQGAPCKPDPMQR